MPLQPHRRISATPQPNRMAAENMNHSIGRPIRNIAMLPTVKSAPAMPPPKTIFDALI